MEDRNEGPGTGGSRRPLIGITADLAEPQPGKPRASCALAYARAVATAGGVPLILPPMAELAAAHAGALDGFVLTGGDDPRTEAFGEPTHSKATPMHPDRQAYEVALLDALRGQPQTPVLGVCLGMQMMALVAGGRLDQHLPDVNPGADGHHRDAVHPVVPIAELRLAAGMVTSHHRQAVRDPGSLRVAALAHDGVIEAVDDPSRPLYLGVQWHPERTQDDSLGMGLFRRLVVAARGPDGQQSRARDARPRSAP